MTVKPTLTYHNRQCNDLFHFHALDYNENHFSGPWMRFQRLQLDSLNVPGGHPLKDWRDRFHEDHPEYFALHPGGDRRVFPRPDRAKLCRSNPGVWDQWLAEVAAKLAEDPNQTVFGAQPNDSWLNGHCFCEGCRAWDHPDGEKRRFRSPDKTQ